MVKDQEETKVLGFTVPQFVVGLIMLGLFASMAGYGPFADDVDSLSAEKTVLPPDTVVSGALKLDSAFVSMIVNTTTVANVDNNYNDVTNVVTAQFDTSVVTASGNTTFTLSTKDSSGATVELLSFNESGTLTVPATDQTVAVTINIDNSVIDGFNTNDEVKYASISASANSLTDDAGTAFYPITVRAIDTKKPAVKVDGTYDSNRFSWLASSATKNVDVTFYISWIGVNKMKDISDKVSVPIIIDSGDDSPITIELIRNIEIL